ncbi:hypothetical protein MKZ38_009776 [Zalerion maritima]|uniref:Uncharacterized protein n=1 Tax=Zalerion maritima TaxID=339359 RepID=A0AAD5RYB6_9PEZI|nr:hypothetical protein MKZ38_009776 [Zalerion maritima]
MLLHGPPKRCWGVRRRLPGHVCSPHLEKGGDLKAVTAMRFLTPQSTWRWPPGAWYLYTPSHCVRSPLLAVALHPAYNKRGDKEPNRIFAEALTLPLYDMWAPLAERYTSLARIEEFMAYGELYVPGVRRMFNRYPLVFPMMMATGNEEPEYVLSSPISAEAFSHASWEAYLQGQYEKPLRVRGLDPIKHGEYTMVLVKEPDCDRLRYGLVTRDAEGRLSVHDPAAVEDAGIGRLPAWTADAQALRDARKADCRRAWREERDRFAAEATGQPDWEVRRNLSSKRDKQESAFFAHRSTVLLGVDAAETICAAVGELATREKDIEGGTWKARHEKKQR